MNLKQYTILKAATNVISGFSMITLICLGVAYLSFKNAFVFQDISIEISNNPVTEEKDIDFTMIGSKKHECNSTAVYGVAYNEQHEEIILDQFTKTYIRNTSPGGAVPNSWSLRKPSNLIPGLYRVSMTGEFECTYLIFTQEKSQTFDNILLIVETSNK
jgi:hypothetical protein